MDRHAILEASLQQLGFGGIVSHKLGCTDDAVPDQVGSIALQQKSRNLDRDA